MLGLLELLTFDRGNTLKQGTLHIQCNIDRRCDTLDVSKRCMKSLRISCEIVAIDAKLPHLVGAFRFGQSLI